MSPSDIRACFRLQRQGFRLDCDLHLPGEGVTVLFGRSGCGKTTLLRCLAGLERAEGELRVGGEIWQGPGTFLPTPQRPLAYVFQEPRLFPHLDTLGNLRFGYGRVPPPERRIHPDEVIDWLGLTPLLQRHPSRLSGGQRQRVAIGRALLTSPRLLLMDEPLAALDAGARQEILPLLESLRDRWSLPVVYVTHAVEELARLADHLVLLEDGRVLASGEPNRLMTRSDLPLAHLDEAGAILDAVVSGHDPDYHLSEVSIPGGKLTLGLTPHETGSRVRVRILARDVSLALEPPLHSSIQNCLNVEVRQLSADRDPARVLVRLSVGNQDLLARLTRRSADQLALREGMSLHALVKAVALMR